MHRTRLLFLAGVLFWVTEPAAASVKRVILRQSYDAGFPPLVQTDALFSLSTPRYNPKSRAQSE
jgi:hypothetical protein